MQLLFSSSQHLPVNISRSSVAWFRFLLKIVKTWCVSLLRACQLQTTVFWVTGWWDASRIELSVTLAGKRKFETGTKRLIWPNRRCYFMLLLSLKLFHLQVSGIGCLPIYQAWQPDSRHCGQKGGVRIIAPLVSRQPVCKHFPKRRILANAR